MTNHTKHLAMALFIGLMCTGGAAHAARLEVSLDAPLLAHMGAALLLYLHIGGGTVGLASGFTASFSEKGAVLHRMAGKVFLVSMFVTYLIGAGVAPFLTEGQRPNFVAGILALYLLISGVAAARRQTFDAGQVEIIGLVAAVAITGMGLLFMAMGARNETGTVDGSPPQAFLIFTIAGSAAAFGELNVLVRRRLSEQARIARHLWRMCASFFIASGSLFLGQPQFFPDWFNQSLLPLALAFFPIGVLLVWMTRVRFGKWGRA